MGCGFERVQQLVDRISSIGRSERGITRLALTQEDLLAREVVAQEFLTLGMSVHLDGAGNLWAELPGKEKLPGVVIGSHLDSVPEGGPYDGVLGVCSGAGIVRDIIEACPFHRRPMSVVVFACEESSRFGISCMGSKAITGQLTLVDMLRYHDKKGVTILNALRSVGGHPETLNRDRIAPASYEAYFELHIEQGPVLDSSGDDVGIVEAIAAPTRFAIDLQGEAAHSGACPMNLRRDALAAAAEIVLIVEEGGRAESSNGSVATVCVCECLPGAMNVVPGRAHLKVDIRGIHRDSIERLHARVLAAIDEICMRRRIAVKIIPYSSEEPVTLDGLLARRIEKICRQMNVSYRRMPSGAGHDAMNMAAIIPSALIFVPCDKGISHNPDEMIKWELVRPGYEVLRQAVLDLVR